MPRKSFGLSGTALFLGTIGVYLTYVGVKDIPFFDGLRDLIRQEKPTPRKPHEAFQPQLTGPSGSNGPDLSGFGGAVTPRQSDSGIQKLQGNARAAYPVFRGMGNWQILGWGLRPSGNSDHPRGKAMDIMTTSGNDALRIIAAFEPMPGAKYWIWNREIANKQINNWQRRRYSGPSPHTDHVHLSFF